MYLKALFAVVSYFFLFTYSSFAASNSEVDALKKLSTDLVEKISADETSLLRLEDALGRTQQDLLKREADFERQKSLLDADPSPTNQRSFNLIENAVLMNKRSIDTQERRIKRQQDKLQNSRDNLSKLTRLITEKEGTLITSVNKTESEASTAVPAEPNKLGKELIAEEISFSPQIEAPAPGDLNRDIASNQNSVAKSSSPKETAAPVNSSNLSNDYPYAEEELNRLQTLMDEVASRLAHPSGKSSGRRFSVKARSIPKTKFEPLGDNMYRANLNLPAGKHTFIIEGKAFMHRVDEKYADKEHVLLFSYNRTGRSALFTFLRDFLNYVDAPIQ